jgi:ferrous iron transport protein B
LGGDLNLALAGMFTPHGAYAFMALMLLSAPCIAAIAATKRELGTKNMWFSILFQCGVAYLVAMIINGIGNLFMFNRELGISIIACFVIALIFTFVIVHYIKNRKNNRGCSACGCNACPHAGDCGKIE